MLPGFVCPQQALTSLVSQENPRELGKHSYFAKFVASSAPSGTSSISVLSP